MEPDILSAALLQAMARTLSVPDLIRAAETLKQGGQLESLQTLYATWVQHNPAHPLLYAVLFNHAVVLGDKGDLAGARACLERALATNPEFIPAHINLGRIYERQGSIGLGVMQWAAALAKMPAITGAAIAHKITALNQSARALESVNQDAAAEQMLRQSLELDCHQPEAIQHLVALRQRQCEWPVVEPWERVGRDVLMKGMSPLSIAAYTDDPLLQLALAAHYNEKTVARREVMRAWPKAAASTDKPLRIGYLSSDLREHAVGYLMTEVFGLHDRKAVEVFAYYSGPASSDSLHAHFKASADHFVSLNGMSDAEAAQRIADDGIQLLVDLNGYTREARLELVARQPAPVIVNWLGFPGSMASPYHHFIIADEWIIPDSDKHYYSEEVLQLPCYQPSSRKRSVSARPQVRAAVGLPGNAFVFCCFNGSHKISRFTFARWMMILARVPGSVLWLLGSTESANERLRDFAAARGIARERIVFADKVANPEHLARYALADLFLDCTPYGAHTTASDALWMGVPTLTLSGRSFASRVCGSLARAAGIPELVCSSASSFVEEAVRFGNEPALLAPIRERLKAGRDTCTLFDMPRLVRGLEDLYREMWRRCEAGELPRPDLANLGVYLEVGIQLSHEETEVQTIADYEGFWREQLERRHRLRPIEPDRRMFPRGAGRTQP